MIYFANPQSEYNLLKKNIIENIKKIFNSNNYILGNEVRKFENNFAKYIGCRYSIGVSSGTDALILSLKALGVKEGDEIITTSHTAYATVAAIVETGAIPVFVDILETNYLMDIDSIKNKITKKTKAIICVHLYGNSLDILKVKKKIGKKIKVIEDCSQSHGSKIYGMKTGTMGDISCYSLYPTKNLSTMGDGGIIVTNNKKFYTKIRLLREYGWIKKNIGKLHGINNRLDEVHASILNVKLKKLNLFNKKRRLIADNYLKKINNKFILLPHIEKNVYHVFHLFVVRVLKNKRKSLLEYLNKNKIFPGIHYELPNHLQTPYKKYHKGSLKKTESICKEIVSLPIYPLLADKDQNKIIRLINNFS